MQESTFSVIILVLFCGHMVSQTYGSCFTIPKLVPGPSDTGEVFCEYRLYKFRNGSSFQTPDCFDCTCLTDGLTCCGFGAALTTDLQVIPPWCQWWQTGCELKAVLKGFPHVACPYNDDTPRPWDETVPGQGIGTGIQ